MEKKKNTQLKINPKGFDPKKYINIDPKLDDKTMSEGKNSSVILTFGRFSPPTVGHEKLVNKIKSISSSRSADPMIFTSHTYDKKKNPLTYDQKIHFLQLAFGPIVKKTAAKTIIEVAKELSSKYDNMIVVVGSDRVQEFQTLLDKYNGKEYEFKNIEVISAGERDPDADDVSGMSASKLRSIAAEGDIETFTNGLPSKLKQHAKDVYETLLKGMKLMEDFEDETLEEKVAPLNYAQRLKRSLVMKRYHAKIEAARKRAQNRKASPEKIKDRARKKALALLRARLSKSRAYGDMSSAEKLELDKRLARIPDSVINRIAAKQIPILRKAEAERFASLNSPKTESVDDQFEMFLENFIQESDNLNKDYHVGLSKSTIAKRQAHFNRGAKMDDNNPDAYKPAPGDARSKTKPSVYTKRFHKLFTKEGTVKHDMRFKMYKPKVTIFESTESYLDDLVDLIESVEMIFENPETGLKKKAEQTGISYGILKKVYDRGVAAWRTGHRPGTTPEQWGFARVNSFATGGRTRQTTDADLWAKHKRKNESIEDITYIEEKSAPTEIKKGDWVLVSKKEHAQVSKYGGTTFTYSKNKLPASSEKMYVYKITKTKDGRKAHLRYDPSSMRGFGVMLDQLPDYMDVKVLKEGAAVDMVRASIARERQADSVKHKNMLDNARKVDARKRSIKTESSEVIQKILAREKKHKEIAKALKDFSAIAKNVDADDHLYHAAKIVKSHDMAMSASDLVKLYNRIRNSKNYEKSYSVFDAWESVDKSDPRNREYGTDSLVKILKKDTPGERLDEIKYVPPLKHSKTTVPDFVEPATPDIAVNVSKHNKHHLGIGLSLKQMVKHALQSRDTDADGDVDAQDKKSVGDGELVADPSFDKTKTPGQATSDMKKKYEKEAKHTKPGVAFESVDDKFETFLEGKARGFEGQMVNIPNVPVRMANGKLKSFPAGKSSSSDGGDGE